MGQPAADTAVQWKKIEAMRLPDMNLPRAGHSVFYVNGELTVVGGHSLGFVMSRTAEYFSEGQWHLMNTVYMHDNGTAVVMDEGRKVLLTGGHEKDFGIGQSFGVELYYPESRIFDGFGCLDHKRAFAQGVMMGNGVVLITGNHQGNDSFERFDGQKYFHHVKDVACWRSSPYLLSVAPDDAIAFGPVWRNDGFQPCDTVDRLKGEPFRVPLLREWIPCVYDQNSHAAEAFIGDETAGNYAYLIAAKNAQDDIAFILVNDTVFSLLPTARPVPLEMQGRRITYDRTAIANRQAHRAYLVGNDTTGRAYVVAVEYDKQPAPLTLYYTDPLPDFGNTTPVLTPDGDLIVTGGIAEDNFSPFSTVWLLPMSERKAAAVAEAHSRKVGLWVLCGLLAVALVLVTCFASLRAKRSNPEQPLEQSNDGLDCFVVPPRNDGSEKSVPDEQPTTQPDSASNELLARIIELVETERLYLNPNLKLTDVANVLAVHHKAVSACINAQGCTFNQWINDYRLRHAKNLLQQMPDMKISTVALESGFANERTFFRVFKEATGMSPKEWAAQQYPIG